KVTGSLRSIAAAPGSKRSDGNRPTLTPQTLHKLLKVFNNMCACRLRILRLRAGRRGCEHPHVPARLTALDTSFLHLEDGGAHMHVAGVMTVHREPPAYDELVEAIEARLHLVPRYRQRLAFVPLGQGRPRWVDDPPFNARYHTPPP